MYLPKLFPFDFFVALDGSWLLIWFGAEKKHSPEVLEIVPAAIVTKLKILSVRFIEIITGNVQIDKVIGGKSYLLKLSESA